MSAESWRIICKFSKTPKAIPNLIMQPDLDNCSDLLTPGKYLYLLAEEYPEPNRMCAVEIFCKNSFFRCSTGF